MAVLSGLPQAFSPILLQNLLFANDRVTRDTKLVEYTRAAARSDMQEQKLAPVWGGELKFKEAITLWGKNLKNLYNELPPEPPKAVGRRSRRLLAEVSFRPQFF